MAATDFHSKSGEVQGDVWELTRRIQASSIMGKRMQDSSDLQVLVALRQRILQINVVATINRIRNPGLALRAKDVVVPDDHIEAEL